MTATDFTFIFVSLTAAGILTGLLAVAGLIESLTDRKARKQKKTRSQRTAAGANLKRAG